MTAEQLMRDYLADFGAKYAGKRVQKTPMSLFAFALSNWSGRSAESVAVRTAELIEGFALYCGRNGVVGTWKLAARWLVKFHPENIEGAE